GVGLRREPRERERVAGEIRNAVKDVRRHVVVREHDGITFAFQPLDLVDHGGKHRDLDVGKNVAEAGERVSCYGHRSTLEVMLNLSITRSLRQCRMDRKGERKYW